MSETAHQDAANYDHGSDGAGDDWQVGAFQVFVVVNYVAAFASVEPQPPQKDQTHNPHCQVDQSSGPQVRALRLQQEVDTYQPDQHVEYDEVPVLPRR